MFWIGYSISNIGFDDKTVANEWLKRGHTIKSRAYFPDQQSRITVFSPRLTWAGGKNWGFGQRCSKVGYICWNIHVSSNNMTNQALYIRNWGDGGNNYVLKGNQKNKWVGFQETVLNQLSETFGDNFNIVIWTDKNVYNDYYCIPYKIIKHLFVAEHKTTGKYPDRWTAIILDHQFLMHSNSHLAIDVSLYSDLQYLSLKIRH